MPFVIVQTYVAPVPASGTLAALPVEPAHTDAATVIVDATTGSTGTLVTVTESTYQPVAPVEESSPSCQRIFTVRPAHAARLTLTWVIVPIAPPHQALLPAIGFP